MGVCPRYLRSRRPSYKIECLGWWFFSSPLPLRANRSKILVPVGELSSTNYLWCCIQLLILLVSLIFSFVSHSNFFPFTTHDFNTRIYLSLNPFILRLILSSCTLVPPRCTRILRSKRSEYRQNLVYPRLGCCSNKNPRSLNSYGAICDHVGCKGELIQVALCSIPLRAATMTA